MKWEVLEYLNELIEKKYGSLDNESGCYSYSGDGGDWLSVAAIVELIDRADEEY